MPEREGDLKHKRYSDEQIIYALMQVKGAFVLIGE
jgi:hypothetical protein